MRDLKSFGLFFEDLAVMDLRVYAGTLGGEVRHYRDNAGLECDAVVHLEDGRWGAIEIKLGGDELIEAGATSLKTLKSKIEEKVTRIRLHSCWSSLPLVALTSERTASIWHLSIF